MNCLNASSTKMLLALTAVLLEIAPSFAQIAVGNPDYEPFANATSSGGTDYTPGANLAGQASAAYAVYSGTQQWYERTASGVIEPTIVAGDQAYPSLNSAGGGGSARFGGNGSSALMNLSVASGGIGNGTSISGIAITANTVYFSFVLKLTDLTGMSASGVGLTAVTQVQSQNPDPSVPSAQGAVVMLRSTAGGFNVGIDGGGKGSTHAAIQWHNTVYTTNGTLFLVGSYDFNSPASQSDAGGRLWINPAPSTFGAASVPTADLTSTGNSTDLARVAGFMLMENAGAPTGLIDDLRVGLDWASVTGGPAVDELTIEDEPADQTQNAGAKATFSVSVTGSTPPVSYQWRKDDLDLSDGGKIFGVTNATLSISNLDRTFGGGYSVKVTDAEGSVTSRMAVLTVNDPFITNQPVNQVLHAGTNAMFQVGAAGAGPLTFRWLKAGVALNDGGTIAGASSANLTISNASFGDAGTYAVRVTNSFGDVVTSSNAELRIIDPSLNGSRPNIVFILCDDLGYGDVGVLYQNGRAAGLPKQTTPNLDTLASEGMQFRRHYCPAPICVPSRASLLLGVHQGHSNVRNQQWDKAISDNHTLANVLQKAGYATAAFGKWGVGGDDVGGTGPADWAAFPTKRGFDYFFGYQRHADGHEHYPKEALNTSGSKQCWDGTNNVTSTLDKCYTADLFTARAKKWLADQHTAQPNRPVFLYVAFDTPHFHYELPTQAYPAGGGLGGGLQWLGTPGHMINTASGTVDSYLPPDYATATYDHDNNPGTPEAAWPNLYKRYATGVRRIDEAVADIIQLLKDLNMDTNTLVVFTSDNGPTTDQGIAANFFDTFGPMDGVKRDTFEGGIRVPTFARWPGTITAGTTNVTPSQFHDWLPTFTDLAGLPSPACSDGVSLVPTLTGIGTQRPSTVYVEFDDPYSIPSYTEFEPNRRGRVRNQMQAIGLEGFQGVRYDITSHSNDFEIYDVAGDPKETNNLAENPAFASLQQKMKDRVLQLRRPNTTAPRPYDNELVPPVTVSPVTPGVEWKAYAEAFPWVPELTTLMSTSSGTTNVPTLAVRPRDDNIGLLFTGYVLAPADGNYVFYLSADTGTLLRIHDATVIDEDYGYVSGAELAGLIKLKAGLHPFRLYYARATAGTPALNFSWSGPGIGKQPIPASAFRRDGFGAPTPPTAHDDGAATSQGTPVFINALANDSDDGTPSPLSIISVGQPQAGTAVTNAGQIVYSPASNFLGEDWFAYTISDGQSTNSATVRVTVFFTDGSYWFPFNQTSGLTTYEAGGGASATLAGFSNDPAQWVAGKFNRALEFDGIANEAVINGFKGITGNAPRTVSAWIKTGETNNSIGIVSWGDLPSGNKWSLLIQNSTDPKGTLRLELGFGNTIAATPVNDGQWHHVACVLSNLPSPTSTNVQFYVDGHPDAVVGGAFVAINTVASNDVLIGSDIQGRFFNGTIDEVRIFNRALSGQEIAGQSDATNDSALAWHRRYFGNAAMDWNADDDGDGVTRLGEYAFGGQPGIPDGQLARITAEIIADHLQIHYHRRLIGSHELIYQIESSNGLNDWSEPAGSEVSALPSAILPGFEDVVFRADAGVPGQSPMFVRVRVRSP